MTFRFEDSLALAAATEQDKTHSPRRLQVETEVVSLFEQFRHRLLRYLISSGLSTHDGEEVVQETFLALFRHLELDKPCPNIPAWLFRVAHNLGLKRQDQLRKSLTVLRDTGLTEKCALDPSPTAESHLVYLQTQQRLRSLVQAMPEQDQRCLALRAEGLRYREIAEVLAMSLGAVSLSLTKSLARLARAAER